MEQRKAKIAILFRGPVRPNVTNVSARIKHFLTQFTGVQNAEITTYLATWKTWGVHHARDLIHQDLVDNVIMQTEPTDAQIRRATAVTTLPNGASIKPVFNMYYQSKTALDLIHAADDYDWIVHTRTDIVMDLGPHIPLWFDQEAYTAPHVPGVFAPHAPQTPASEQWMCDQFGIAPASWMHRAWDYGSIRELGRRIEAAVMPEAVLQTMIQEAHIPVKAPPYIQWQLDPRRNG